MCRIALIRSASSAVSKSQYNIQEIGMAKKLAELGMRVDVFLISDTNNTYQESIEAINEVIVYWLKGFKIPGQQGFYPDLMKILDSKHYDLIQALDDSQITTVLVSSYCKKHKIKFVLWQGMYENYPERYKKIIQWFYDRSFLKVLRKNTKYCIAKTTLAKMYLESKRFKNIDVIPVGLEVSNFENYTPIDYRSTLDIPKNHKIYLYVGRVEERRKPIFCMQLFSEIVAKHTNSTLVYVGKGPMLEEAKQFVNDKGIPNVIFIERIRQNELPSLYMASDLLILPTRYEIFGMVLMEAMYFGTPVITYSAAGPVDVINNGVDGLVLHNFDLEQWLDAIEVNLYASTDFDKMRTAASQKIINSYLWSVTGAMYFEDYARIKNSKP